MTYEYELTLDDYTAFSLHLKAPGGTGRQLPKGIQFIVPAIVVVLIMTISPRRLLGVAGWLLLLTAVGWAIVIYLPRVLARRDQADDDVAPRGMRPDALGPRELIVDEQGVTERTPYGAQQRNWCGIERVAETARHLFIFTAKYSAFIVPKSSLGTSVDALRDALAAGIASSRKPTI